MSKPVLVTGATGFIGRALVGRLIAASGDPVRVRCLVRDPARAVRLGLPESSCWRGSLGDETSLRAAAEGVGAVVHLAGLTRALSRREFEAANAVGAGTLAGVVAGVAPGARFVLISSLAAAGPGIDGRSSVEPPDRCRPCSVYGASKLGGELRVLEHSPRLDWCVIRPPIVYGPGDDATRLLFRQASTPLAVVPWRRRPLSLIHVDDLVRAIELAVARVGVHGFFPVEGPDRVDTDSLVTAIAAACGRRARLLRIPMVVPRAIAPLADLWAQLTRRPSFFNSDKMREASAPGWVVDPRPAREQLGFEPSIDVAAGLLETALAEGHRAP